MEGQHADHFDGGAGVAGMDGIGRGRAAGPGAGRHRRAGPTELRRRQLRRAFHQFLPPGGAARTGRRPSL